MKCPECQFVNPNDFKFCGRCGHSFGESSEIERTSTIAEGERKHVTVLFSDLSGYTSMCEKLDPEEVKEIMSRMFGDIARVVAKYEGFIEKFIGDAVVALFGVPRGHEDDPVRAIRAAGEINESRVRWLVSSNSKTATRARSTLMRLTARAVRNGPARISSTII